MSRREYAGAGASDRSETEGNAPAGAGRGRTEAEAEAGDRHVVRPETAVPPDETPAATCPHCDRPFRSERQCALHVGEAHADAWTPAERDAYEAAHEEEEDELFLYHLKVVAALGSVYAAFVILGIIGFSIAG